MLLIKYRAIQHIKRPNNAAVNTDVAGTTISTSTKLGYRWLNGDRS